MKVTSRERTLIIIGVVVVAAVLIFYAAGKLVPDGETLSQDVDLKKRMLRSQRETLSREEFYRTRLERYRKQLDQEIAGFLPGDNSSLAGAELQKVLKEFADRSGVEITQRNMLPEKKALDVVTKVSIRIETNCTPEQLVQFLASIQNHEKLLKIDEMLISSLRVSRKYEIRPSLTISGFIRTEEEKPKAKTPAPTATASGLARGRNRS